ncbi:MAG: hypothetical protein ACM362_12400, partial [Candidatus Methylomirabilota bacterium]
EQVPDFGEIIHHQDACRGEPCRPCRGLCRRGVPLAERALRPIRSWRGARGVILAGRETRDHEATLHGWDATQGWWPG